MSPARVSPEDLKSSNEIFKVIFESAPDGIYLNDLRGNFIDGNKMTETLTGYPRQELICRNFLTVGLLPTDQIPKAAVLLAKNLAGKPSGPDELILKRKDGTLVPVEISTYPAKVRGKAITLGIASSASIWTSSTGAASTCGKRSRPAPTTS